MTIWLAQHGAALRLALTRLAAAPLNTLLSLLAIGIALALPAGGQMLLGNGMQLARNATPQPQLSVFMVPGADSKATTAVADHLRHHPQVRSVEALAKEDTLARMKSSGGLKDVIEVLGRNPFPDAFVVTPGKDDVETMESLATEFRQLAKVDHVQLDSDWVRRLNALLKLGRTGVGLLTLLLGAGLVAITFNIIRLQVVTMRAEMELSRLLGATDDFIRRPFLYYGSVLGVAGGIFALGLVAAAAASLNEPLTELTSLYGLPLDFAGLPATDAGLLLLLAAGLGWSGAALSLQQYLRD
jgi:cell division transport system permease protein